MRRRGALLPLPLPCATAGRPGTVVRRSRRAGCFARHNWPRAGHRSCQTHTRSGGSTHRSLADVRRPANDLQHIQNSPRQKLPCMWRQSNHHRTHGLSSILLNGPQRRGGLTATAQKRKGVKPLIGFTPFFIPKNKPQPQPLAFHLRPSASICG